MKNHEGFAINVNVAVCFAGDVKVREVKYEVGNNILIENIKEVSQFCDVLII